MESGQLLRSEALLLDPGQHLLEPADLLALVQCGRELAAQVDLDTLLRGILDRAGALTDSPDGSIILYDERRDVLYFAAASGANAAQLLTEWGEFGERSVPIDGSKAGQVFRTGIPLVDDSVAADPDHFKGVDASTRMPTASLVCVPLVAEGRRLGVVQLLNKRSGNYTARDRVLLEHFAAQAAVAIRNAQLFQRLLAHMGLYASRAEGAGPMELLEELERPARTELLTVLFADMRGFTQLCQVVDGPETARRLLNEFLTLLAGGVIAHRGIVNKFLGDGILALFRGGDHAERAVRCAFELVDGFARLRADWDARSNVQLGFLDIGVGVATDTVMIGAIGSEQVRDFTAIGTAVNLASYFQLHARGGKRVLVDRMTYRAAKELVDEAEGPEAFELKKPGQTVGHPYERYHLKRLKPAAAGPAAAPVAPVAPDAAAAAGRADVFVSYSHKDRAWLDLLHKHLRPYLRPGTVAVWDDTRIRPGALWREEIERALAAARVAVLLVSPDFLDSEFIARSELPPLLAAAQRGGLTVLWVPLSASSFDETPIAAYQATIDPARPLDAMDDAERNRVLVGICKTIKAAIAGGVA
jgi:adenylate cyclase